MRNLFPTLTGEIQKLQPQFARDTAEKYVRKLFTGVLEFSGEGDSTVRLILSRGDAINAYWITPAGTQNTDPAQWHKLIQSSGEITMRALTLNPHILRYVKIMLNESPSKTVSFPALNFEAEFARWIQPAGFTLIHLRWRDAEGLITLIGKGQPVQNSVFISGGDVIDGTAALSILMGRHGTECEVRLYDGKPLAEPWMEYHLHRIFILVVEGLLARYGELTGRIMVNTAAREFNFHATTNGWNVNIIDGKLADNALFNDSRFSLEAYSSLLSVMVRHMQSMIGSGLINLVFREISAKLDSDAIETLLATQFIPELMIAGSIKARK